MNMHKEMGIASSSVDQAARRAWLICRCAAARFSVIDGEMRAGAFAYNAFFALFPLIVFFFTIASPFVDHQTAAREIIGYVERYVPISGEMQHSIFDTITGVVNARGPAGLVAFVLLTWVAMQCLSTLISAINRAWDNESYKWWQLPMKSLVLLVPITLAVLVGTVVPVLVSMARKWLVPVYDFHSWVYGLWSLFIPLLTVFFSLCLFYKISPRRTTRYTEVWGGALCASVLLQAAEELFVIYLKDFATLNVVYGAFGGIMALLLWIYLSGGIFIFGACWCAAQADCSPPGSRSVTKKRGRKAAHADAIKKQTECLNRT